MSFSNFLYERSVLSITTCYLTTQISPSKSNAIMVFGVLKNKLFATIHVEIYEHQTNIFPKVDNILKGGR